MKKHHIDPQNDPPAAPRSRRLREIMDSPPGFWLRGGIALTCVLFAVLFLLLCLIPMERYGGVSIISYLLM